MKMYILISLWFLLQCSLFSQPILPENGVVFNDKIVPKIYISIHPDSFQQLFIFENLLSDHEYPADFSWDDGEIHQTIKNVGFRLRGKSSRYSAKKSFKIKFDHFGSETFYGLSELNINGEHNDPSIIRSKLCWDLMRFAGIEGSRSNHVALYVNGDYMGLYINTEHIDKQYLRTRKKDPDGQLFKCFYGVDLVYSGDNPNSYSKVVYEPVNNKNNPDYVSFTSFLKVLNSPNAPDFRCKLEEKFDVDDYLKRLAIEILSGHWDNPVYNKNNAYLYHNPKTGKYQLLSYDLDNTFGIDWFNVDWSQRNVFDWTKTGDRRPVYEIIHHIPEYRERLGFYIDTYTNEFFNQQFIQNYINPIKNRIAPFRTNDPFAPLDYGYTFVDFLKSYDTPLGYHVKNGLYEYIRLRYNSAKNQIGNPKPAPIIEYVDVNWKNNSTSVTFFVISKYNVNVQLHYSLNNGEWKSQPVYDDGLLFDEIAGDNKYHWQIPLTGKSGLSYYVTATDSENLSSRLPFCAVYESEVGSDNTPLLKINEFMADNTKIPDNAGEYDDWLELYNADSETIWLGDKYLTDNPGRPDKWKMPAIYLEPGAFILFWADEDQNQGQNHTNFKLSKDGEFLGIFDSESNNLAPIDTFHFGVTATNISYGRYPDGVGNVIQLNAPTPGYSNVITSTEDNIISNPVIFPNPATDHFTIQNLQVNDIIIISQVNGTNILSRQEVENSFLKIDTSDWKSGVYLVNIVRNEEVFTLKLVKI